MSIYTEHMRCYSRVLSTVFIRIVPIKQKLNQSHTNKRDYVKEKWDNNDTQIPHKLHTMPILYYTVRGLIKKYGEWGRSARGSRGTEKLRVIT
jgi:hypothetical protein